MRFIFSPSDLAIASLVAFGAVDLGLAVALGLGDQRALLALRRASASPSRRGSSAAA